MDKNLLDKIVDALNKNSIDFKFDSYIHEGKSILRGFFIYSHSRALGTNSIKKALDNHILKNIKILKTYNWYLGEREKVILLKLKKELELEIPELEKYPVSNYS